MSDSINPNHYIGENGIECHHSQRAIVGAAGMGVMGIPDEWANALEQECDHCGEVKPCLSAKDPFVADIYPDDENDESFWCQECWESRCDER